jgi:hypothetical protein
MACPYCLCKWTVIFVCIEDFFYELSALTALQTGRLRVRFSMVSLKFFIDKILSVALWPWGRLSL